MRDESYCEPNRATQSLTHVSLTSSRSSSRHQSYDYSELDDSSRRQARLYDPVGLALLFCLLLCIFCLLLRSTRHATMSFFFLEAQKVYMLGTGIRHTATGQLGRVTDGELRRAHCGVACAFYTTYEPIPRSIDFDQKFVAPGNGALLLRRF